VNGNDQVIVIYGLAKRASEVLGSLSVDARVASAEYVNSVREKGGSEQFSIKILLKNELTKPENVYFLQNNLTSDQSAISQESPTK
jgi:predicted lactoylglutathione lyase